MKLTKNRLKEIIRQTIKEIDFKDQAAFDAYNKKHKMRKSTKVNVAGKDTTAGDAAGTGGPSYANVPKGAKTSKQAKDMKSKEIEKDPGHGAYDMDSFGHEAYIGDDPKLKAVHARMDKMTDEKSPERAPIHSLENMTQKEAEAIDNTLKAERDRLAKNGRMEKNKWGDDKLVFDNEEDENAYFGANQAVNRWYNITRPTDQGGMFAKPVSFKWKQEESITSKLKREFKESMGRKTTVKEIKKWFKTLEENRYKKTYNSDARRVSWLVNNSLSEDYDSMPISMKKKWPKAQYSRERFLAKEFIKHLKSKQMNEVKLTYLIRNTIKEVKNGKKS